MIPDPRYIGSVLVHHSDDWVGRLEDWGQWTGGREDLQATHVETIYDLNTIAKMNPPVSSKYPVEQAPWPVIRVLRLHFVGVPGVPEFPDQDPAFQVAFQAELDAHMGEKYGWWANVRFGTIGILARVWPWAAQKILSQPVALVDKDCSEWLSARIENTIRKVYPFPDFDLFTDTGVGDGEERPADYVKSKYLVG